MSVSTPPRPKGSRGGERSRARDRLIEAAEAIMVEEGYAAVTARRLCARAGLKSMLLHYYFEDMDALFCTVIRRRGDLNLERLRASLEQGGVLRRGWGMTQDETNARLSVEFMALSAHRPLVRDEFKRFAEEQRKAQSEALERYFRETGITPDAPPVIVSMVVSSLSTMLWMERMNGVSLGHDALTDWMTAWLKRAGEGRTLAPDAAAADEAESGAVD